MYRILSLFCRTVQTILFFCMLGMTVIMVSLVITRYFFSYSPSWSEEVPRYLMVWMVMLGASVLVLFDDHITLYMFAEKLGRRARLFQTIFVRVIVAAVGAVTTWTGFKFANSMWVVTAPGTQWPMAHLRFLVKATICTGRSGQMMRTRCSPCRSKSFCSCFLA